jgi:hypothetical protein
MVENVSCLLSAIAIGWWMYTNKVEGFLQLVLILVVLCSLSSAFTKNTANQSTPIIVTTTSGVRANGEQKTEKFYNIEMPLIGSIRAAVGL